MFGARDVAAGYQVGYYLPSRAGNTSYVLSHMTVT